MSFCCLRPTTEMPSKSKKKDIRRSGHDLLQNKDMDTSLLKDMNSIAFTDMPLDLTQSMHSNMTAPKQPA